MISILLSLLFLAGCAHNPVTGKNELHLISESQEISIGEEHYVLMQQAQGGAYQTLPEVQEYVQTVGDHLAAVSDRPHLPYEFVVLNNSIPNAWALPGGKIAINRGLLTELHSEAELAAVLSHEIVHSAARHGAKAMEKALLVSAGLIGLEQLLKDHKYENIALGAAGAGAGLLALKYSRNAELEADRYGIKYMVAAGYDPEAAVTLQKVFLKLSEGKDSSWLAGLLATHPPSEERIRANEATVALYPKGGKQGVKEYETALAGLTHDEPAYEKLDKGYAALVKNKPEQALFFADEGLEIEPREPHLYNLKGKALAKLERSKDALTAFNRAIELDPDYFDFYLQKGLLEMKMGDLALARLDLDKSRKLLPSAEVHYALGEIDLQRGRPRDALAHFQIAANVDSPIGHRAKEQLAALDLPQHPYHYITAQASWTTKRQLHLTLRNSSALPVHQISVQITFLDAHKRGLKRHVLKVSDTIPPHGEITLPTPLRVPSNATFAQAKVLRAEPIQE